MLKGLKNIIVDYYKKIAKFLGYYGKRKALKNKTPSIISSDCIGGVIYNNLGLKFNSPTINLWIPKTDFWEFVSNLNGYLSAELTEVYESGEEYPVGTLSFNNKTIKIYFLHYHSFTEAKNKWNERKKRVDFSNIYIIQVIQNASAEDIIAFNKLPYKNKMLITGENPTNSDNVVTHKILLKNDYRSGEIFEYKSRFKFRRNLDSIDYVSFLNS